jgi:hypothetical protein
LPVPQDVIDGLKDISEESGKIDFSEDDEAKKIKEVNGEK